MTAHMEYALEYWKTVKPEAVITTNQSHIEEVAAHAKAEKEKALEVIAEINRVLSGIGEML